MIKGGVCVRVLLYSSKVLRVPESIWKFNRNVCNGAILGKLKKKKKRFILLQAAIVMKYHVGLHTP